MSTNSSIGYVNPQTGTIHGIYCHWDGHLHSVGRILLEYFKDPNKIMCLIDLGDVSSLAPSIIKPDGHTFNTPVEGYTIFYGRDRGESGCRPRKFANEREFCSVGYRPYKYLFKDGKWFYRNTPGAGPFFELTEADVQETQH